MIRRARRDESATLLRIQRDAGIAAFSHVFPQDRFPFPDDEVHENWKRALADPDVEVYVAEADRLVIGSVSVGGEFSHHALTSG